MWNADSGGVAERLKAPVLKTGMGASPRGFESLPLRHFRIKAFRPSVYALERGDTPELCVFCADLLPGESLTGQADPPV
jgi:hypothetical protein